VTRDEDPPVDDDDAIFHNVTEIGNRGKRRGGGKPPHPGSKTKVRRVPIPVMPAGYEVIDLEVLKKQATNPTKRARAAFNMKKVGIPLPEIAEFLDYETPGQCFSAICGIVAAEANLDQEGIRVMQATLIAAQEANLRRSIQLASATTFRDAEGNEYPNEHQLAWHQEARKDIEVLARISGAQAAVQVQLLSPEAAELDAIVREIEALQGRAVVEADVLQLEEIRDA